MARPRNFDTGAVVEKIRDTFWEKGYEATSMQDLVAATGVRAGSLHAVFGKKEDLFAIAFDAYHRHFLACADVGTSGVEAIRRYIEALLASVLEDRKRRGCLIVQSAMDLSRHSPANQQAINARLAEFLAFFQKNLEEDHVQQAELASSLFGATVAMLALGRSNIDRSVLEGIAAGALKQLPTAATE